MNKKIFSLLVLLFVAATGAWATDYYVVGTMNDWGASKQFQLKQNPNNEAEYMITLSLKAGAEFKVIGVGENTTTWYPDGTGNAYGENGEQQDAGIYTIYFRPDYQGGEDWFYNCIFVQKPAIPLTDLGNNSWEFTMPANAVVAKVEYDTELELHEENINTTVLADWNGYEADVTLTRTLTGGMWNTLALPFSISSSNVDMLKTFLATQSASIDFKELKTSSYANGTLTLDFDDAAEIKAGHPYLVKTSTNVNFTTLPAIIDAAIATYSLLYDNPFKNVEISSAIEPTKTSFVDFIPTLGKTTIGSEGDDPNSILFLATGNTLLNPNTMPTYMKGFRAYFQLKGDAVGASRFALNIDEETTAVSDLKINEQIINNNGYDLQGRRMEGQPTKKGVYIVNGKKVVIK